MFRFSLNLAKAHSMSEVLKMSEQKLCSDFALTGSDFAPAGSDFAPAGTDFAPAVAEESGLRVGSLPDDLGQLRELSCQLPKPRELNLGAVKICSQPTPQGLELLATVLER